MMYFGHASATSDEPGSAAVHFHDTGATWGMATPRAWTGPTGARQDRPGDHRPLAALDLLLGTLAGDEPAWRC